MQNEASIEILGQKLSYPTTWQGVVSVGLVCTMLTFIAVIIDGERLKGWLDISKSFRDQSNSTISDLESSIDKANETLAAKNKEIANLKEIILTAKAYRPPSLAPEDTEDTEDTDKNKLTATRWWSSDIYKESYSKWDESGEASTSAFNDYVKSLTTTQKSLDKYKSIAPLEFTGSDNAPKFTLDEELKNSLKLSEEHRMLPKPIELGSN